MVALFSAGAAQAQTAEFEMYGRDNIATVTQVGNNFAYGYVNGNYNDVTINQSGGHLNQAAVTLASPSDIPGNPQSAVYSNVASIEQVGSGNLTTATVEGLGVNGGSRMNQLTAYTKGQNNDTHIKVIGDRNLVTTNTTGNGNTLKVDMNALRSTVDVAQKGNGKYAEVFVYGQDSNASIKQAGGAPAMAAIHQTGGTSVFGSNNKATIDQTSVGTASTLTSMAGIGQFGVNNTASLLQNGSNNFATIMQNGNNLNASVRQVGSNLRTEVNQSR